MWERLSYAKKVISYNWLQRGELGCMGKISVQTSVKKSFIAVGAH
jgi:hypothetical protein